MGFRIGSLLVAAVAAGISVSGQSSAIASPAPGIAEHLTALDALPIAERMGLERAVADASPAFAPRGISSGSAQLRDGAVVSGGGLTVATITLGVSAIGRGGSMRTALGGASVDIDGRSVEIDRGGEVTEWWRSVPSGLEQGVTLARRP